MGDSVLTNVMIQALQGLPEERFRELTGGKLEEVVKEAVAAALEAGSGPVLAYAKEHMYERLQEERERRAGFESRLFSRWKAGFDLFEIFSIISLDAGRSFYERNVERAKNEKDFVFEALYRIHTKACLTASEVYSLMRTGHASAAMARWRTLHELAVVAFFIKKYGADTAERYLLHNVIESWKVTSQYQRYHKRIDYEPIDEQEVGFIRTQRDQLCARYGPIYGKSYGWAASALGINDANKRIVFDLIERASGIDHLRPFYKMASHGIHSESKGGYWNLGVIGSSIVLAGPSNTGFCDAAHSTLISLYQCTVCFLTMEADIEDLMVIGTLQSLLDEAGDTFLDIQKELEREEKEQISSIAAEEEHCDD
jgi:hypothetical protein